MRLSELLLFQDKINSVRRESSFLYFFRCRSLCRLSNIASQYMFNCQENHYETSEIIAIISDGATCTLILQFAKEHKRREKLE